MSVPIHSMVDRSIVNYVTLIYQRVRHIGQSWDDHGIPWEYHGNRGGCSDDRR